MEGKGAKSMERLDKRSDSGQGYKAVISRAIYRHLPVEERVSMQTLRKDGSSPTGFICSCSDASLGIVHRERRMCCMSYLCQHAGLNLKGLCGLVLLDNGNTVLHPDGIARGFIRRWKPFGKNK